MKKYWAMPFALLLSGCINAPNGLQRDQADILAMNKIRQQDYSCQCKRVRLGGKILNATALKNQTKLEVFSQNISLFSAKPILDDYSDGRFIAYIDGFIDPASLTDHYITVAGILSGQQQGYIDQAHYTYPIIQVTHYKRWRVGQESYYDPEDWADYREARRMGWGYAFPPEPKLRTVLY
ncbi:MAG: Slp family lipoprotein [Pasteurellaceae bacterium]|nr:Slp family lipoprotein [Pasteurellaceae bacterium]